MLLPSPRRAPVGAAARIAEQLGQRAAVRTSASRDARAARWNPCVRRAKAFRQRVGCVSGARSAARAFLAAPDRFHAFADQGRTAIDKAGVALHQRRAGRDLSCRVGATEYPAHSDHRNRGRQVRSQAAKDIGGVTIQRSAGEATGLRGVSMPGDAVAVYRGVGGNCAIHLQCGDHLGSGIDLLVAQVRRDLHQQRDASSVLRAEPLCGRQRARSASRLCLCRSAPLGVR